MKKNKGFKYMLLALFPLLVMLPLEILKGVLLCTINIVNVIENSLVDVYYDILILINKTYQMCKVEEDSSTKVTFDAERLKTILNENEDGRV